MACTVVYRTQMTILGSYYSTSATIIQWCCRLVVFNGELPKVENEKSIELRGKPEPDIALEKLLKGHRTRTMVKVTSVSKDCPDSKLVLLEVASDFPKSVAR